MTATVTSAAAPTGRDWDVPAGVAMTVFTGAAGPKVAGHAREWVVAKARSWGVDAEGIDNLKLVTSELVTNAWTHTASRTGWIVVHLIRAGDGAVRVEVRDNGRADGATPALVRAVGDDAPLAGPQDATHGRGLPLLAAFSEEWGVEPYQVQHFPSDVPQVGHTVWAHPKGAYTA